MEDILMKKGANYFGNEIIDASGKKHYQAKYIRGNGRLYLRKDGIYFTRWIPKKDYFIPINRIENVTMGRFHNLKTQLLNVLKIHYKDNNETIIFGVCIGWKKETLRWKEEIDKLLN